MSCSEEREKEEGGREGGQYLVAQCQKHRDHCHVSHCSRATTERHEVVPVERQRQNLVYQSITNLSKREREEDKKRGEDRRR